MIEKKPGQLNCFGFFVPFVRVSKRKYEQTMFHVEQIADDLQDISLMMNVSRGTLQEREGCLSALCIQADKKDKSHFLGASSIAFRS